MCTCSCRSRFSSTSGSKPAPAAPPPPPPPATREGAKSCVLSMEMSATTSFTPRRSASTSSPT
eukprot:240341-Chlamydomonas_euryale.AAC.22